MGRSSDYLLGPSRRRFCLCIWPRPLISINGGTFQSIQVYARGVGDRELKTAATELAREFEKLP
jgi:hypothetical protein